MNYKPHLQRIQEAYGKLDGYGDCSDFEKCIIILKKNNCTYKQIQKWLGNPSKEIIKDVICKYVPETLNNENNNNKLPPQKNINEKRLIGILNILNEKCFELDEFGYVKFYIVEGNLYFMDENNECYKFNDWDERTQQSIIYNIAKLTNFKIN